MQGKEELQKYPFRLMLFESLGSSTVMFVFVLRVIAAIALIPILFYNPIGQAMATATESSSAVWLVVGMLLSIGLYGILNYPLIGYFQLIKGVKAANTTSVTKAIRRLERWYVNMKYFMGAAIVIVVTYMAFVSFIQIVFAAVMIVFLIVVFGYAIAYNKMVRQLLPDIEMSVTEEYPGKRYKPHLRWAVSYLYGMIVIQFIVGFLVSITSNLVVEDSMIESLMIFYVILVSLGSFLLARHFSAFDRVVTRVRRKRMDEALARGETDES